MDAQGPCDPVPEGAPATRHGPGHRARAFVGHHGRGVSALQAPALVRGLVLLSGYYFPTARLDVALNLPLAIPGIGDAMRHTVSPLLARLMLPRAFRKMFEPAPVPEYSTGSFRRS